MNQADINSRVLELFESPPLVHSNGEHCWKVSKSCAHFLATFVNSSTRTIETGCGLSTIIFALGKAQHICVVPDRSEVERLREYCSNADISLESVTFHIEPSQRCLPVLEAGPFDLVLIDGCHSFPSPFIDWYYLEPKLVVGGVLMIDDTHLWTARVLRDVLKSDPHWALREELPPRTAILEKMKEGSTNVAWDEQPYVYEMSKTSFVQRSIDHLFCRIRSWSKR